MNDDQERFAITYRKPTGEQARQPLDRYQEMTLQYNYRKELKEARKPHLYGLGIDFYEEEKLRGEHGGL